MAFPLDHQIRLHVRPINARSRRLSGQIACRTRSCAQQIPTVAPFTTGSSARQAKVVSGSHTAACKPKLGVDVVPVGHDPHRRTVVARRREQAPLQLGVVDLRRHRPGDPDHRRATQILGHRRVPDPDRTRDRPHARAARMLQPQNLSNLPHRHPLGWHRVPPHSEDHATGHQIVDVGPERPSSGLSEINRNHCPASVGISVRLASESLSAFPRIPHYPADYHATVEVARQERDSGAAPKLKTRVANIAGFQTVYLCFPIWGETTPPVIRSFLTAHDLSGKTLISVITHGGYGPGDSLAVLRSHAPHARLVEGFAMQGPQERETTARITAWLNATH